MPASAGKDDGKRRVAVVVSLTAVHAAQAMDVLLDAIARTDGTRESVTRKLFSTRISNGLLGSFWITSTGDTTLNAVTIFRIAHHRVTTFHLVTVPEDLLDAAR
jgi:ABC-type branched-subunit amino acid transport system substrate-binding protein